MPHVYFRLALFITLSVSGVAKAQEPCSEVLSSIIGFAKNADSINLEVTGINGLEKVALLHFQGDMASAYDFALKNYGIAIVVEKLKWPRLTLKTQQSMGIRQIVGYNPWTKSVLSFAKGSNGQERTAIAHFDGDHNAAFDAAAQIYGDSVVQELLGWTKK